MTVTPDEMREWSQRAYSNARSNDAVAHELAVLQGTLIELGAEIVERFERIAVALEVFADEPIEIPEGTQEKVKLELLERLEEEANKDE